MMELSLWTLARVCEVGAEADSFPTKDAIREIDQARVRTGQFP